MSQSLQLQQRGSERPQDSSGALLLRDRHRQVRTPQHPRTTTNVTANLRSPGLYAIHRQASAGLCRGCVQGSHVGVVRVEGAAVELDDGDVVVSVTTVPAVKPPGSPTARLARRPTHRLHQRRRLRSRLAWKLCGLPAQRPDFVLLHTVAGRRREPDPCLTVGQPERRRQVQGNGQRRGAEVV